MKIEDIMYKIMNGEEVPKKIKYDGIVWEYKDSIKDYEYIETKYNGSKGNYEYKIYHFFNFLPAFRLQHEVEIIEENKYIPEKIEIYEDEKGHYLIGKHCEKIYITCDEVKYMIGGFNQLIDYLKSKGE